MKADTVLTRATQAKKEAVNEFPDDRYPSMLGVLFHLKEEIKFRLTG